MKSPLVPFVLCWALVGFVATWSPTPAPAAPEGGVAMRVVTVEGPALEGRLLALDDTTAVLATAAGRRVVPLASVLSLTRQDAPEGEIGLRDHLRVHLTGGEILVGTFAGATSDGLLLQTPDLGRVPLLLDFVETLVCVPAGAGACFEPEHRHPPLDDDVLYTRSGDEIAGIVLAVDDEGFEIETVVRGRTRRVTWDELLVAHLENDPPPPPSALRVELETTEGSRLEASGPITTEDEVLSFALRSAPRTRVEVPLPSLRVVRLSGGAFVYASTLPFTSEFTWYYGDVPRYLEYLERWFAARVDRRPSGCPLRLAGRTYRHGFAVHSRSTLTIQTGKAWKRFESLFGVDDQALDVPTGGVVDARILGDGEVLWEAKDVRAGEEPRHVGPLDVSQVETLVLWVGFGADLVTADLVTRDYATWADPLLFR